jgi:hypothetical protein
VRKIEKKMYITDLNEDELIMIFQYCSEIDQKNLCKTCKLFENLIDEHFNEGKCQNLLMVTHIKNYPDIFERTLNGMMRYWERMELYQNWTFGSCQQFIFFQHRENYRTFMQLNQHHLFTANLGEFNIYNRHKTEGIKVKSQLKNGDKNESVINALKRKGEIISGIRLNGTIFTYSDEDGFNSEIIQKNDKLLDFDFHNDIFVTSTKNNIKFYRQTSELGIPTFESIDKEINLNIESINFDPTGHRLLTTYENNFNLIDVMSGTCTDNFINVSQIYKTQWINDSSFLFTNRNNPLSLIDTRQGFKVQDFSCGRFTATCIDYDGRFGVIYGTLLGMIILCDIRNPNTFERVFHLDTATICREIISDERHLFVSTDNAIYLLNFN